MSAKSGWKTSEFWVTIAMLLTPILNGVGVPIEMGVAEQFVGGAYALGRSLFKAFGR